MTKGDDVKIWCDGIQEPFTFKFNTENIDEVVQFLEDSCTENSLDIDTNEKKFMFQKSKIACIEIIKDGIA